MPVRMFGVLTEPVQKIPPEARISPSNHTLDTGHVPKKKDNKKSPKTRIKNGFSDKLCVCFTLKKQKKTNSKPTRFEFERKNKGAKYSFRRQADTERCELVLTWRRVRDSNPCELSL